MISFMEVQYISSQPRVGIVLIIPDKQGKWAVFEFLRIATSLRNFQSNQSMEQCFDTNDR